MIISHGAYALYLLLCMYNNPQKTFNKDAAALLNEMRATTALLTQLDSTNSVDLEQGEDARDDDDDNEIIQDTHLAPPTSMATISASSKSSKQKKRIFLGLIIVGVAAIGITLGLVLLEALSMAKQSKDQESDTAGSPTTISPPNTNGNDQENNDLVIIPTKPPLPKTEVASRDFDSKEDRYFIDEASSTSSPSDTMSTHSKAAKSVKTSKSVSTKSNKSDKMGGSVDGIDQDDNSNLLSRTPSSPPTMNRQGDIIYPVASRPSTPVEISSSGICGSGNRD